MNCLLISLLIILLIITLIIKGNNGNNGGNNGSKSNFEKTSTSDLLNKLFNKFKNKFEKKNNFKNLDVVDCVYCVVMPTRKNYMEGIFNKLKINYTFFNAITPKDLDKSDYSILSNTYDKNSKLYSHPTRLPLQLSFTMCYLDAIKKGYSNIIIFEDDIVINVDTLTLIDYINEFKKSDYAFFYMGYCWLNCNQKFTIEKLINVPDRQLFCCHSICYKVKYLPSLIKSMYPMTNNLDDNIVNFIKENNYKVCVPSSTFFDQNRTDLGTLNDDDNNGDLPNCNAKFN